jgi:hypothetical protein
MIRLATALAAAVLALGLAGCGNDSAPAPSSPNDLGNIQHTLDNIEQDMTGDDSQYGGLLGWSPSGSRAAKLSEVAV